MYNLKKSTVFLAFGICCQILTAQNPYTIKWSAPFASEKDFVTGRIIHVDSTGILLLRQEIEEYYEIGSTLTGSSGKKLPPVLEHYTPDFQKDYSFELKGWSPSNETRLFQAGEAEGHFDRWYFPFWTNQKPWFIYSNYNKDAKNTTLYVREIDLNKRKLSGVPIELFLLKDTVEDQSGPVSIKGFNKIGAVWDQASSKVMFYTFPQVGYPNKFNIKVFDRKMRALWAKSYELPFIPNAFEIRDICLSSTGKFYCLARIYELLPENGKSPVNITFMSTFDYASFVTVLLEFNSSSENANMYRLDMGEMKLVDAKLTEDKEGLLHCIGGYTPDQYTRFYGCVDFVLNPFEQTVTTKGPFPFTQALLQKISLEKNTVKKPFIEAFSVDDINIDAQGDAEILGSYYDYKGSYHNVFLNIDQSFKEMDGVRIKKSQLIKRQSEWLFAGSIGSGNFRKSRILLFNDDIQGDNQINLFEWANRQGNLFQFTQPDPDNRLLLISKTLGQDAETVYLIGESRSHKMYRIGSLQRKQ